MKTDGQNNNPLSKFKTPFLIGIATVALGIGGLFVYKAVSLHETEKVKSTEADGRDIYDGAPEEELNAGLENHGIELVRPSPDDSGESIRRQNMSIVSQPDMPRTENKPTPTPRPKPSPEPEPEKKPPHTEHSWLMKSRTEAGCEKPGTITYVCAECKQQNIVEIPATGHSFDAGQTTSDATCVKNGTKTFTCSKCNATKTEEIPAKGHEWSDKYAGDDGYYYKKCNKCKETEKLGLVSYSIKYDLNGGAFDGKEVKEYTVNGTDLPKATKPGFNFVGWRDTYNPNENPFTKIKEGKTGELSLKAVYEAKPYMATFKDDEGNVVTEKEIRAGEPIGELPEISKPGHSFSGWYTTPEGGISITPNMYMPAANVTFYAIFDVNNYSVSFKRLGVLIETYQVAYGTAVGKLPDATRDGYMFLGWRDTSNDSYLTESTPVMKDTECEADYQTIAYKLEIDYRGGEGKNPPTYTVETDTFSLAAPVKKGRSFKGWLAGGDERNVVEIVTIPKGSTGDRKYTAVWEDDIFYLTYELDGGYVEDAPNPGSYSADMDSFYLRNPVKKGYTFVGWTSTLSETPSKRVLVDTESGTDIDFTAHYRIDEYPITYNLDGGRVEGTQNPDKYTVEDEFMLYAPNRTGYAFKGWSGTGAPSALLDLKIEKGTTGALSFVAEWIPDRNIKYKVVHKKLAADGSLIEEESQIFNDGESDATKTPAVNSYPGYTSPALKPTRIAPDGSTVITYEYPIETYSITYALNGGTGNNPGTYTVRDAFTLTEPARTGYSFQGWTGTGLESATHEVSVPAGSTGDREYEAHWDPRTDTAYTVKHYLQNADGTYTLKDTEVKHDGTSDQKKIPATKENEPAYRGYRAPTFEEGFLIKPDGTTVIDCYYTLITYQIRYYGLEQATYTPTEEYTVLNQFALGAPSRAGFDFLGWIGSNGDEPQTEVIVAKGTTGDLEFEARWTASTNVSYKARHYQKQSDGTYRLVYTDSYTDGTTGSTKTPPIKDYTSQGYELEQRPDYYDQTEGSLKPLVIQADGSAVRDYYYSPIVYTLTYTYPAGIDEPQNPATYTCLTETFTLNNPSKQGYVFYGWTGTGIAEKTQTVRIPKGSVGNREYVADIVPDPEMQYAVELYIRTSMTGSSPYTLKKRISMRGTTGTDTNSQSVIEEYTGYDTPAANEVPIRPDGATVVRYDYEPTWYTITCNLAGGELVTPNPEGYNILTATFTLNNPKRNGYRFLGWTYTEKDEGGNDVERLSTSVTINRGSTGNREYTATYEKTSYAISYDFAGGSPVNPASYPSEYYVDSGEITLGQPQRNGYEFRGWTGSNGTEPEKIVKIPTGSTGAKTYTANWILINGYVEYTIIHKQMSLQNVAVEKEREVRAVLDGAEADAPVKTYSGFASPEVQHPTISSSTATTITYVYTRETYNVIVELGEGVQSVTGDGPHLYGSRVVLSSTPEDGYVRDGYEGDEFNTNEFTMPAHDVHIKAKARPAG